MQGTIIKEQQYLISNCVTAFEAWTNLHNVFDKQNSISSFSQIKAMYDLKHSDNSNIIKYIQIFGIMWSDLQNHLSNSSEKIATNAKALVDMNEYKTIVFLASLSSSMNDIVDNLQTLPNVTYVDVISKLQSLRSSNQHIVKALSSLQRRNGKSQKGSSSKRSVKPNPTGPGKTPPPNKNKCSWYKK